MRSLPRAQLYDRERLPLDIGTRPALTAHTLPGRFYDTSFLNEYGRIEASRAVRFNASFSTVLIDIEGPGGAAPFDGTQGAELLEKIASAVADTTRTCDVAGLSDGGQVMIILPETDYFGALTAIRKLDRAFRGLLMPEGCKGAIFSHATFPRDGKGFGVMVAAAARMSAVKRESLWVKLNFRDRLFWEIIGELTARNYKGDEGATFDAGAGQDLSEFFLDQVNDLVVREIARAPQRRGLMYYAAKNLSDSLPVVKAIASAGTIATRIFLVCDGEGSGRDVRGAVALSLDDPRLKETFFTFFLNEDAAYALVCKENWGATFSCFHTSDRWLVEGLIAKFQHEYALQEQFG